MKDALRLGPPPGSRLVVVGGCGGLGRALIEAALALDLRVVNLDIAQSLERHKVDGALGIAMDVTDEESVRQAMAKAAAALGGIDAVVNLAGFADPPSPVAALASARWDATMDVNLRGAFLVSQAALPELAKSTRGAMVHIASGLAVHVERGLAAYSASKAGLIALVKVMAKESAPGVRINAVAPGPVDTPFLAGGLAHGGDGKNEGWLHTTPMGVEIAKTIPMGRIGMPQDVVGPTLFLLGDAARYMTGQTLFVNGGRYMP